MTIRYLTPFILFLALFFVSGAIAYYFHNEKMRLEFEIKRMETEELGVTGAIYKAAVEQIGEMRQTHGTKGLIAAGKSVPTMAEPTGDLRTANYISSLRQFNVWLRAQTDRVRKIANIKSQHTVGYGGVSTFDPNEQVKKAKEWLGKVNEALEPSIRFVTTLDPGQPGSGVLADRDILNAEDKALYQTLRTRIEQQRSEISNRITEIRTALNSIERVVAEWQEKRRLTTEQLRDLRRDYSKAAAACYRMLNLISYTKLDGSDKNVPIPGLIDSPLKRAAVQLAFYLLPSDAESLRRPAPGEDNMPGEISPTTPAAEIAYRSLIEDYFKSAEARQFNLQPYYLAGVSLEDVIDNQDILIATLLSMNHQLAKELMVQLATLHQSQPKRLLDGDPRNSDIRRGGWPGIKAMVSQNENDNTRTTDESGRVFSESKTQDEGLGEVAQSDRNKISTDVKDEINNFYSSVLRQIDEYNTAQAANRDKLRELFFKIKKETYRLDGTLKLSGTDGSIVHLDNTDQIYHIDLGEGDNIRLGMRFVVLSELGGETIIKGLIEVVRIPAKNFSVCRLVTRYTPNSEILVGDKVENRLYHNRRYLRVACIGDFQPPYSYLSQQQIESYLRDLGCEVQAEPDVNSELVIRAEPVEKLVPSDERRRRFLKLRERVRLDEIEPAELMIYFQDK